MKKTRQEPRRRRQEPRCRGSADGSAETNDRDDGPGTMEALYFGSANGGENHGGAGAGPWIMADMENALWVR